MNHEKRIHRIKNANNFEGERGEITKTKIIQQNKQWNKKKQEISRGCDDSCCGLIVQLWEINRGYWRSWKRSFLGKYCEETRGLYERRMFSLRLTAADRVVEHLTQGGTLPPPQTRAVSQVHPRVFHSSLSFSLGFFLDPSVSFGSVCLDPSFRPFRPPLLSTILPWSGTSARERERERIAKSFESTHGGVSHPPAIFPYTNAVSA